VAALLGVAIAGQVAWLSLLFVYTFSTWVPYTDHVASSIDRLVFQVLPLALLLLALSVPRLRVFIASSPGSRGQDRFGRADLPPRAGGGAM